MSKAGKKSLLVIYVYLPREEHEQVLSDLGKTTCRSLSEYARKRITGKPITVYYRDQSYDEFIELGIQLKKRLDGLLSENVLTDTDREELAREVTVIKELLIKIYDHVRGNKIHKKY